MSCEQERPEAKSDLGRWFVRIDRWHPTPLNELLRLHWSQRNRRKRHDADIIALSVLGADVPPATLPRRVSLEIILRPKQRACDPDAYWKTLLDALVKCGALVNDSHHWCQLGEVQFSRAAQHATIIELQNLKTPSREKYVSSDDLAASKKRYRVTT